MTSLCWISRISTRFVSSTIRNRRGCRLSQPASVVVPVSLGSPRFYSSASAEKADSDDSGSSPSPGAIPEHQTSEKIENLVNQIAELSLLEATALVDSLKSRLNIKDIVAAQPVAVAGASASGATADEAAEPEEPKQEQTEFSISLESFEAASKAKVIREMKSILPNANLVEAKKFVEGAPKLIMESIPKEQVEKIKTQLEAVGAKVKIE